MLTLKMRWGINCFYVRDIVGMSSNQFCRFYYWHSRMRYIQSYDLLYYAYLLSQGSATPGTRAACGTRDDFSWHAKSFDAHVTSPLESATVLHHYHII